MHPLAHLNESNDFISGLLILSAVWAKNEEASLWV